MAGHEITTRLPGGRGEPLLIVRDRGVWEQQVRDENRARADEQIKAAVADIQLAEQERKWAPPVPLAELASAARANAALYAEAREAPERVARELAQTEALVTGMMADVPPEPTAEQARRDQD